MKKRLDELKDATNKVISMPLSEDEFPDVLGAVRFNEVKLSEFRQATLKEAPEFQQGEDYDIVTTQANDYSFNLQRIMLDLGREGLGIKALIDSGAVELTWKISKLMNLFDGAGLPIEIEPRELTEDDMTTDGPHVGKFRKPPYSRVVGRRREEANE